MRIASAAKPQCGVSLIELLIGMVLAMLVIGGAVAIYSNTAKSHGDALQAARLAQNMRAAMAVMQREIARAGYASDTPVNLTLNNPFLSGTNLATYDNDRRIEFIYNKDNDAVVDDNERLGFRLSSNTLHIGIVDGWESIVSPDITVTALSFVITANTLDVTDGDTVCNTGHRGMTLREVAISLTARLQDDTAVQQSLQGRVQVKNHKLEICP